MHGKNVPVELVDEDRAERLFAMRGANSLDLERDDERVICFMSGVMTYVLDLCGDKLREPFL